MTEKEKEDDSLAHKFSKACLEAGTSFDTEHISFIRVTNSSI